mmetsp:Transcript_7522/g.24107  ORF Transcript_7522/g.24107 Transcript_7522/m.24107 type:complete len:249 (-) Transcript_7522:320-1066(-)
MALSAHLVFVQGLFEQLQQHPHGLLYYVLFLAGWTLCCLPTTPVEIAAGFTWSVGLSSTASSLGKTIGSCTAFALSRLLLAPLLSRSPATAAGPLRRRADAMLTQLGGAVRDRPFRTVFLLRAAPLPIALKNYGLGLMPSLPSPVFVLMTFAVNVPFSVAWALAGTSASSLQEALQGGGGDSSGKLVTSAVTALVLLVSLGYVGKFCREQLREMRSGAELPEERAAAAAAAAAADAPGVGRGGGDKAE